MWQDQATVRDGHMQINKMYVMYFEPGSHSTYSIRVGQNPNWDKHNRIRLVKRISGSTYRKVYGQVHV